MTRYNVFDQDSKPVGHTTNQAELRQFLATHPGYEHSSSDLPEGSPAESTLPKLQEEPGRPKGDFLRQ